MSERPIRDVSDREVRKLLDGDPSMSDRWRRMEKWDDYYPDGEGEVPSRKPFPAYDWGKSVQWVRVTKGREDRRVVATFLLWWKNGQPFQMGIAVARRGLPPNPYEDRRLSMFDWWAVADRDRAARAEDPDAAEAELRTTEDEGRELQGLAPLTDEERADQRARSRAQNTAVQQRYASAGWWGTTSTPGARPTIEVYPIPSPDGDYRWRFPEGDGASFKVRGSLLAQALFTLRMTGQQRVSVYTLRETVNRIQQG